jgi:hypothetical protein
MPKVITNPISALTQGAIATLNQNFANIQTAMEDTLSRGGTIPNQMTADLDLNSNDILNVGNLDAETLRVNGSPIDLASIVDDVEVLADQATAAQAAAVSAAATAEAAAAGIEGSLIFFTRADAQAYTPMAAPQAIRLAGCLAAGDLGDGLYKQVASQPSHAAKFSINLLLGGVVWYEFADAQISPMHLGATGDGSTDDRGILAATDVAATALRIPISLTRGTYSVASNLTINSQIISRGGLIKPASGVTVTISKTLPQELTQLFDMSAGGKIELSKKVAMPEWFHASTNLSNSFQHAADAVGNNGTIIFSQAYTQTSSLLLSYQALQFKSASNKRFVSVTALGNFEQVKNTLAGTTLSSHFQSRGISWIADPTCNVAQFDLAEMAFVILEENGMIGSTLLGNYGIKLTSASNLRPPMYSKIRGNTMSDQGSSLIYLTNYANSITIADNRLQPGRAGVYCIDVEPTSGQYQDNLRVKDNGCERGGALSTLTNGIRLGTATSGSVQSVVINGNRFEQLNVAINASENSYVEGGANDNYFGSNVTRIVSAGGAIAPTIQASVRATLSGGVLTLANQPPAYNTNAANVTRISAGRFRVTYLRQRNVMDPHIQITHGADATTSFTVKRLTSTVASCEFVVLQGSTPTDPEGFGFVAFGTR